MKTILLIEDNRDMRENTSEILQMSNYRVLTAENGKIGVSMAEIHKPDLIICDVMMPELDGFGVLSILSKKPETASIPFIFCTAKVERTDYRKGMSLGADDYITKPFDDVELLDAVESRLKKNDIIKKEYSKDSAGLQEFISEARGLKELEKLSDTNQFESYRKKEVVYSEGNTPHYLYFINNGKIKTYRANSDGKELITCIYQSGEFFGYSDLLDGNHHTETAAALEDTVISLIPKNDFFNILFKNRDVASKFIKMISNDLHEKEEQLLRIAYNSVRKRVAEALIYLEGKFSTNTGVSKMVISRDDLANIVGTATETVIRTLADFKSEQLVEFEGKGIRILDRNRLMNLKN